MRKRRCAIYTRKSSDEGLDQDFNSLDAQREACAAFIVSQKHEGWVELPNRYDDGGYSGGNMERPGLTQLLADVSAKRVDVIVVYKVDRLTRSLADFAKIVEVLDAQGISFVAVTQQFNTTTSMGRLTLNVLLSFAQFEREISGERIRDKFAASKAKGMWMGGNVPLGYEVQNRALVINKTEADKVKLIFDRYIELKSVHPLAAELNRNGITSHRRATQDGRIIGGHPLSRGTIYAILRNPIYIGQVSHKGTVYPGLHQRIIAQDMWDQTQEILAANRVTNSDQLRARNPSLLKGILFDADGERLVPSHSNKKGARYRYYISQSHVRGRPKDDERGKLWRIPAPALEVAVMTAVRDLLSEQSRLSGVLDLGSMTPAEAQVCLERSRKLVEDLASSDGATLRAKLRLLLSKVTITDDRIVIAVSLDGLRVTVARSSNPQAEDDVYEIVVPIRIAKRGVEQKLIIGGGSASEVDLDAALIRGVARAHGWFDDLRSGRARDLTEIAKREQLPPAYVRALVPLAFLSPKIVAGILDGRQPADLTLKRLVYGPELPISWGEQHALLGL